MKILPLALLFTTLSVKSLATSVSNGLEGRQTFNGVNYTQMIGATIQTINGSIASALTAGAAQNLTSILEGVSPAVNSPSSVQDAVSRLQALASASANNSINTYSYGALLRSLNLVDSIQSLLMFISGVPQGQNSMANSNPDPPRSVYNQNAGDAPYSVSEPKLRAAIHIPPGFTSGKKPPVILFPGTGNTGYTSFQGNFIKLLQGSTFADPVWVNVPGYLFDDAQTNAEYAAYAINYVAAISDRNVTVLTWSQGGIDVQWAFKYWPSTRSVTPDHVAISPDYKGTVVASLVAPDGFPQPPSIFQQRYLTDSNFITTLRSNGGDSAYVPTTTVYSGFFDEIVEPQSGTAASAYLNDARGVGVSNNQVQVVCSGQPGGSVYNHEGVLYSPLALALLKDAMTHDGPGRAGRLDMASACGTYLAPGLDLGDLIVTENAFVLGVLGMITYPSKVTQSPAIKAYAAM